jgi:hypothetical protein
MALAVSNVSFSWSGAVLYANWTTPSSTASIDRINIKITNSTTSEVASNYSVTPADVTMGIYDSAKVDDIPAGTYNLVIDSMSSDNTVLATAPIYTLTIASNTVTQIVDSEGNTLAIGGDYNGGGGGGEGEGEGGGGGVTTEEYVMVNGIAKGLDAQGNPLWVSVTTRSDHGLNCIQTSPDGVTWTARTCPLNNVVDVAFGQDPSGNNMFLAIGNGGMIAVDSHTVIASSDGVTWNEAFTLPGIFTAIAFGKDGGFPRWNLVGYKYTDVDEPILYTSSNGVTWSNARLASTDNANALSGLSRLIKIASGTNYNGTTSSWVAVGQGPAASMLRSADGINWTLVDPDTSGDVFLAGFVNTIAYNSDNSGNILWVAGGFAVSTDGTETEYFISTSTDSVNWTRQTTDLTKAMSVAYGHDASGGSLWVIAGGNSEGLGAFATSPDGVTWTSTEFLNGFVANCVTYAESEYIPGQPLGVWIFGGDNTAHTTNILRTTNFLSPDSFTYNTYQGGGGGGGGGEGEVPGAVVDFTATPDMLSINLTWKTPLSDGGSAIRFYTISVHPNVEPITVTPNESGVYAYNVAGLLANTLYAFTIVAVNGIGDGASTKRDNLMALSSSTAIPFEPMNITVVPSAASALVSWTAPSANPAITGYKIYCNPDNKLANTASANATSLNVTGLKNGTPYTFSIVATNSLGTSYTASCTPSTLPGVPKVTVVGGNGQVTLSWVSKPAVGVPTTEFLVSCTNQEGVVIPTTITSPMTISGLTNGTSYIFSVKAVNIIGHSLAGLAKAVIPTSLPSVPTSFAVVAGIKSFQVTWAAPTTNGGLPITEYTITYSATIAGLLKTTVVKGKPIAPYSLMVTKLLTGTVYTVSMQAKNKLGLSVATSSIQVTSQ